MSITLFDKLIARIGNEATGVIGRHDFDDGICRAIQIVTQTELEYTEKECMQSDTMTNAEVIEYLENHGFISDEVKDRCIRALERQYRETASELPNQTPREGTVASAASTGTELPNDEFILLSAVRYALGKKSYIAGVVCEYVEKKLQSLSQNCIRNLIRDIMEELDTYHRAGESLGDECDERDWVRLLAKLKERQEEILKTGKGGVTI